MQTIRETITNYLRGLAETLGFLINPIVLKAKGEHSQLLVFYFHGLYESTVQKELHHIDPQKNMTVSQFGEFIDYFLNHKYSFLRPEDLLTDLSMDKRYAMITFDDGYFNNMLAINVLKEYNIPSVFFITAKNVIEHESFWWDVIYKYRFKQGLSERKIQNEQELLKQLKHEAINNYVLENFGPDCFKPWSDIDRPMTEKEVKLLANSPHAVIGNHTFNHAILPNYSKEEMTEEIFRSNKFLENLTGITPISIAFPNGNFNRIALDVAKETGFRVAFNAIPRKNTLPIEKDSLISINRFMANNNNIRQYGSFYRAGYTPGSLQYKIRKSINPLDK